MDAIYCITENYYFYVYLMEDQSETKNQEVDYEWTLVNSSELRS